MVLQAHDKTTQDKTVHYITQHHISLSQSRWLEVQQNKKEQIQHGTRQNSTAQNYKLPAWPGEGMKPFLAQQKRTAQKRTAHYMTAQNNTLHPFSGLCPTTGKQITSSDITGKRTKRQETTRTTARSREGLRGSSSTGHYKTRQHTTEQNTTLQHSRTSAFRGALRPKVSF